jgi:DNA-binding CsgD family transcriptional regulator
MHVAGILRADADLLEQAAERHRRPWAQASALEDAGAVLASCDTGAARDALNQAEALYKRADAHHDASRARSLAQALRTNRGARADRPVHGWISLTDGERKVARLVAEGLTNEEVAARLYVSRHTVDFHLRSVYRKLDVHSRVQLTRLVSLSPFHLKSQELPARLIGR